MHVPDNWDRPHSAPGTQRAAAASYYPPLRFKEPSEAGDEAGGVTAPFRANGSSGALGGPSGAYGSGLPGGGGGFRDAFGSSGRAAGDAYGAALGRRDEGLAGRSAFAPALQPLRSAGADLRVSASEVSSSHSTAASASDFRFGARPEERVGLGRPLDAAPATDFASGFSWPPESERTPSLPSKAAPLTPAAPGADAPEVEVRGTGDLPGPWRTWDLVDFPARVRAPIVAAGFPAPTSIQQSAWPVLTMGRDLIGIAKTGSGKTLAFLLPAFARLVESRAADLRGPPSVLVMAPTRELACQIEQEAKRFGGAAGMRAACLYGGAPKGPQLAEMRMRPQVLVATPGRLNDLLDPPLGLSKAVDVDAVRYLCLDEADRMLDMGFEPQIRKIIAGLSKDRQTVMFTATWPASVRRLAAEFLRDPVEVRVGEVDSLRVNPDVEQRVEFCIDSRDKEERLARLFREHGSDQAIVFVNTKRMCEVVAMRVENSVAIHGDKDQRERDMALAAFKSGARRVMVATDVAARGLDIKAIRLVVNFDPPNRDEDYVHRVGRTGRAGNKGIAVSLLTNDDGTAGRFIADILKRGNLPVPEELERRLASGEMRMGGGGGGRDPSRGPSRMRGRSRGPMGGDPFADDFDFDMGPPGGGRFGDRFAPPPRRGDDFSSMCATDCPTY